MSEHSGHPPTLRIQVLYFDGCPHSEAAIDLVRRVAASHAGLATIESLEVSSHAEAERLSFLGSPSVHVNGVDIDPQARERTDFGMACRLYGPSGVPSADLVVRAIREAMRIGSEDLA